VSAGHDRSACGSRLIADSTVEILGGGRETHGHLWRGRGRGDASARGAGEPGPGLFAPGLRRRQPAQEGYPDSGITRGSAAAARSRKCARRRIDQVLIAIPSASRPEMIGILSHSMSRSAIQTVPSLAEIIRGPPAGEQIRDVRVDDLLGRNPVAPRYSPDPDEAGRQDRVVTGAAAR